MSRRHRDPRDASERLDVLSTIPAEAADPGCPFTPANRRGPHVHIWEQDHHRPRERRLTCREDEVRCRVCGVEGNRLPDGTFDWHESARAATQDELAGVLGETLSAYVRLANSSDWDPEEEEGHVRRARPLLGSAAPLGPGPGLPPTGPRTAIEVLEDLVVHLSMGWETSGPLYREAHGLVLDHRRRRASAPGVGDGHRGPEDRPVGGGVCVGGPLDGRWLSFEGDRYVHYDCGEAPGAVLHGQAPTYAASSRHEAHVYVWDKLNRTDAWFHVGPGGERMAVDDLVARLLTCYRPQRVES